jgi:hypothetical protein
MRPFQQKNHTHQREFKKWLIGLLITEDINTADYIASNNKSVNNELEGMSKEAGVP